MLHVSKILAGLILVVSAPAMADNHIKRSELEQIALTRSAIYFHLEDGSVYKGRIVQPKQCPTNRFRKVELPPNINRSFKLHHPYGWTTCKIRNLEKLEV